jgi:hypothetical protein
VKRVEVAMKLPSVANLREHWTAKHRRVKKQRKHTALALLAGGVRKGLGGPVHVVLTRLAAAHHQLDSHDNLRSAFKAVVDEVAKHFGLDDADPEITFEYRQEVGAPGIVINLHREGL